MSEKIPAAGEKTKSYWHKLASSFTESLNGVVRFCGEFIIVVVAALPALVLIFVFAFIAFIIYKKFAMKLIKFKTQKDKDI
jgi:predicted PurR-regulated permease PerM